MNKDNCREEMGHPEGITCSDCFHCERCTSIFGQSAEATHCQFYPRRFFSNYEAAKEITNHLGWINVSTLQRKLLLGYNAARLLVERLEKEGILGPFDDGKWPTQKPQMNTDEHGG